MEQLEQPSQNRRRSKRKKRKFAFRGQKSAVGKDIQHNHVLKLEVNSISNNDSQRATLKLQGSPPYAASNNKRVQQEAQPEALEETFEAQDEDEQRPLSFWQKIKSLAYSRVPVFCNLYAKHELAIENLISTYLHVGGMTAHNALKHYCARKLASTDMNASDDTTYKSQPGKLSRIIDWVSRKLQFWATSFDEPVDHPSPKSDAGTRNIVFYPQKLNLILFPPSQSSAKKVLDDGGEEESQTLSSEQLRDELWNEFHVSGHNTPDWEEESTTTATFFRKTKRSCLGRNCLKNDASNERKMKDLNDLSVVISGFDKSPVHFMMGDLGKHLDRQEKVEGALEVRHTSQTQGDINDFEYPLDLALPSTSTNNIKTETKLEPSTQYQHNKEVKLRQGWEKSRISPVIEPTDIQPELPDNTFNYEYKPHILQELEKTHLSSLPTAMVPQNSGNSRMPISNAFPDSFYSHPNTALDFKVIAVKLYLLIPAALFIIIIICICCFLWHKRKMQRKYDLPYSDSNISPGPSRYLNISLEGSDVEEVMSDSETGKGKKRSGVPQLQAKSNRHTRKKSHEDDYESVGPFRKKKNHSLKTEKKPLISNDASGTKWRESGTLTVSY